MNVSLTHTEIAQLSAAIEDRRAVLDGLRKKLVAAGLDTHVIDEAIETLDALKVSLGIDPEDMFKAKDNAA